MEEIAGVLEEAGYETFLPHRDGVEAFTLNAVDNPLANLIIFKPVIRLLMRATFALDICRILDCDYFVFNMNGRVPDEGGVVETGVAFAAGKPIVIYENDPRVVCRGRGDPVVMGASYTFNTVSDVRGIPGALEALGERMHSLGYDAYEVRGRPAFVRRVVLFGQKVRWVLRMARFLKPKNKLSV